MHNTKKTFQNTQHRMYSVECMTENAQYLMYRMHCTECTTHNKIHRIHITDKTQKSQPECTAQNAESIILNVEQRDTQNRVLIKEFPLQNGEKRIRGSVYYAKASGYKCRMIYRIGPRLR